MSEVEDTISDTGNNDKAAGMPSVAWLYSLLAQTADEIYLRFPAGLGCKTPSGRVGKRTCKVDEGGLLLWRREA